MIPPTLYGLGEPRCCEYVLSLYTYPLKISMGIREALYAFLVARFMKYFTETDGFRDCQETTKNYCKQQAFRERSLHLRFKSNYIHNWTINRLKLNICEYYPYEICTICNEYWLTSEKISQKIVLEKNCFILILLVEKSLSWNKVSMDDMAVKGCLRLENFVEGVSLLARDFSHSASQQEVSIIGQAFPFFAYNL